MVGQISETGAAVTVIAGLSNPDYYDKNNQYCTKRKGEYTHSSNNKMPPNILFVREVGQSTGKVSKYCKLIDIGNNYSYNETAMEHEIYAIRQELEGVWNEKTRYHGTIIDRDSYISKGQCGVSSLLLARLLETEADLKKLKIHYSVKSEKTPETVNVEHLIERLAYLERELNEGGINYE